MHYPNDSYSVWKRYSDYKLGFYLTQGTIQNMVDSTLKNLLSTEAGVQEMAQGYVTAMNWWHKYLKVQREITNMNHVTHRFSEINKVEYFKTINRDPDFTMEIFDFVHGYDIDGPSADITRELYAKRRIKAPQHEDILRNVMLN
jgi:hypothetical protein